MSDTNVEKCTETAIFPPAEGAIDAQLIAKCGKDFSGNPANKALANATVRNGISNAAMDYQGLRKLSRTFDVELALGSVTNQRHSGRCWMFSGLNMLRYEIMHKLNLEDFELSQNYLFFWDKFEKSNFYLENILSTLDRPIDDRLFEAVNAEPATDGGWWTMFANLVRKYGVMPVSAYPDSANAEDSDDLNRYLSEQLRNDAAVLRAKHAAGVSLAELRELKKSQLDDIYRMLVISLGEPPKSFDFIARSKAGDDEAKDQKSEESKKDAESSDAIKPSDHFTSGRIIEDRSITPLEFFKKYCDVNLDDYIDLLNAPVAAAPLEHVYQLKNDGNVVGGEPIRFVNIEMDRLEDAIVKQLKAGHPVWFACDCLEFSLRKEGVFDKGSLNIEGLFGIHYDLDKGRRIEYGISSGNHAMSLVGVHFGADGRPDRWKIENSWGKAAGDNGYYVASEAWFEQYVYDAAVRKEYVDDKTLAAAATEPVPVDPWEPLCRVTRCE